MDTQRRGSVTRSGYKNQREGFQIGTAQGSLHLMEAYLTQATDEQVEEVCDLIAQGDNRSAYIAMHALTDFNLPVRKQPGIPLSKDDVEGILLLEPEPALRRKLQIALAFMS